MNGTNNHNHEIDLVDFSSSGEMARIREQERIEKENREKQAIKIRRAEMLRRKKMQQIKQTVFAWSVVAMAVIIVVAVIVGIVSMFSKEKEPAPKNVGDKVSPEQIKFVSEFDNANVTFYVKNDDGENAVLAAAEKATKDMVNPSALLQNETVHGSELAMLVEAYIWNGSYADRERVRQLVRDFPLYSNGYVWSSEKKMTSPVTGSFLYDTNAAFISAVCEICAWDGNVDFLDAVDSTVEAKGDASNAMTVGEKLDKAVMHFFNTPSYLDAGGVRYNADDGLVYVRTPENKGKPSNMFLAYRFGYADTYINLTFNKAMQDLAELYTLRGDKEKAELYAQYAKTNREAINKKLFNEKPGRYVACIDEEGKIHDNGFTTINLMAVALGVADKAQTEKILSWIDGERTVKADGIKDKDVLENGLIPVFSTVEENGNMWYLKNEYPLPDKAEFGKFWMNGAPSALSANYYLLAAKANGKNEMYKYAVKVLTSMNDGKYEKTLQGNGEPRLYGDLLVNNAMKCVFGISSDGRMLAVVPRLDEECFGVKNVAFSDNTYNFLFDAKTVYVTAEKNMAVKISVGGFSSMATVTMTAISEDEIVFTKELTADAEGLLTFSQKFGNGTYIKLEEVRKEK